MSVTGGTDGQRTLTRSELELELGKLALVLGRLQPRRNPSTGGMPTWPSPVIDGFLDACVRVLAQTRSAHRGWVIERLCHLAASAQLGIIGLNEWLADNSRAGVTSDRLRVRPGSRASSSDAP